MDRLPTARLDPDHDGHRDHSDRLEAQRRLTRAVYNAEREAIVRLRDAGDISDEVLQRVSREIDLAETRPTRT